MKRFYALLFLTMLGGLVANAQMPAPARCGLSTTVTATGRVLLAGPGGVWNVDPANYSSVRIYYRTTGSPASVSAQIEDSSDPAATMTPIVRGSALTNTTAGDWGFIPLSGTYLWVNTTALSGGATLIVKGCFQTGPVARVIAGPAGLSAGQAVATNASKQLVSEAIFMGDQFATIAAAITALPATGGTVLIPPGTYVGPTSIPSNVSLIGIPENLASQGLAGTWGATPGGVNLARNGVTLTYTGNLTLSLVQNVTLKNLVLNFQNNAAGLVLTSVTFSHFDNIVLDNCGGPSQPCLTLNTNGSGGAQNNNSNNIFTHFKTNAFAGLTATHILAGVLLRGNIAAGQAVTLNRFYDLNIASGGTLDVGMDFDLNCDTNFVQNVIINNAAGSTVGIRFNSATPGSDQGANSNIILGYSPAAAIASPFVSWGASTGNFILALGNAIAPTVLGGTPANSIFWEGATSGLPTYFGMALNTAVIGSGGTTITKHLSATASLDFANLAAIGCEDLTITVTGAALGDSVDIGVPNGSMIANGNFMGWVSATDTVTVRFCTLVSGNPAAGTFRADVWQH